MTETQLLILVNIILIALVPLEWLYYRWQERRHERHEGGASTGQPCEGEREASPEGDRMDSSTNGLPVETAETS